MIDPLIKKMKNTMIFFFTKLLKGSDIFAAQFSLYSLCYPTTLIKSQDNYNFVKHRKPTKYEEHELLVLLHVFIY